MSDTEQSDPQVGRKDSEIEVASERPKPSQASSITWPKAYLIGLGIFAYFVLLTVWLPSRVLRLSAVASSSQWLQDAAVTTIWGAALGAGIVGLRSAQKRGWI